MQSNFEDSPLQEYLKYAVTQSQDASSASDNGCGQSGGNDGSSGNVSGASQKRDPKKYLSVKSYASGYYRTEFSKLLSPNFADKQTRSVIERSIDYELMSLQVNNTYGYRDNDEKREMKEKRARDVARSAKKLYAQLTSALSKHSVIVRDIASLPKFSSGGIRQGGVYGH